ncbi:hypothetical protein [Rhodococcus phenolicus]|uniref:hypothetical protein n=1 Tax=Rhodococcus phenolicus TaxID=263849 RepID=UPI000831B82A|nr:hypothetical protein [Rhodococcus phenolicus]
MTEKKPDTGQISVAELLARNGKTVDSRAGGRRRRGTSGGISVAELTGEIPITPAAEPTHAEPDAEAKPASAPTPARVVEAAKPESPKRASPTLEAPASASATPAPAVATPKPAPGAASTPAPAAVKPAPVVKPAPAVKPPPAAEDAPTTADSVKIESPTEVIRPSALPRRARAHLETTAASAAVVPPAPVLPRPADGPEPRLLSGPASDLRGTGSDDADSLEDTDLIGGAVADPKKADTKAKSTGSKAADSKDGAEDTENSKDTSTGRGRRRRGAAKDSDGKDRDGKDADTADETSDAEEDGAGDGGGLKQWAMLAGESVAAIVAGALLFKGFERLWDSLPWVAFALALLVIVGLVAVVRILRRTDDITSQLIALAVGAFVTFGPLLFLLPNG